MKNITKLLIVVLLISFLSSCFNKQENDNIIEAKKQMWIIDNNTENTNWSINEQKLDNNPIDEIENKTNSNKDIVQTEEKKQNIEIVNITSEVFLDFDSLDWVNLLWWEVEITWTTLANVDTITVEFSNNTSDYPDDNYKLQKFKAWDKNFLYRAFSNYETLDFWINEYIFTAISWNRESKTKIILNVTKEETKQNLSNNYTWDIDFKSLPIWENFWEPKQIWNWKITYSDIKWLEIEKKEAHNYNCSKNPDTDEYYVSELLDESVSWYYWWNTCRPFWNNEWINFFVLRLDWNDYIYEKHIYLNNWLYWIYELSSWEDLVLDNDDWSTKSNKLQEKNNELKEKNSEFTIVEIINDLFTKILN